MASPVVSPAPAPAPRRRGTLGLDGNTPAETATAKRKSLAGRLAAMFKSPAKEKKKTSSGAVTGRADASINPGSAAWIAAATSSRWVGPHAVSLQPFRRLISRPRGLSDEARSALWS